MLKKYYSCISVVHWKSRCVCTYACVRVHTHTITIAPKASASTGTQGHRFH